MALKRVRLWCSSASRRSATSARSKTMVVGTVVFGRALTALRLLAQEHHSRADLGG